MKCVCIQEGQARLETTKKVIWVEPGQVHDIVLNEGGKIPAHFEKYVEPKPAKKGAGKESEETL